MIARRVARSAAVLLAAAALSACGGTGRLVPETPPRVNLAGTWKLNRQASDDPQAMIEKMQRDAMKHMRRHDDGDMSDVPGSGYLQRSPYAQALGAQLTSDELTLEQSPTRLVLIRGDWRRSFTPGAHSVVSVAEGVADQQSGWSGRQYVIEVKPQVGPRVIERYGLSADNRHLVEKVTLTEEGLPKLEFTRLYDPGALTPRAAPTSN